MGVYEFESWGVVFDEWESFPIEFLMETKDENSYDPEFYAFWVPTTHMSHIGIVMICKERKENWQLLKNTGKLIRRINMCTCTLDGIKTFYRISPILMNDDVSIKYLKN